MNLNMSIPKCLEEFNAKYENLNKEIKTLTESLSNYEQELKQLREKYNAEKIESEIASALFEQDKTYEDILKIKYIFIAEIIFNAINLPLFTSRIPGKQNTTKFFKWLQDTFNIVFNSACNYISFSTFYKDYIKVNWDKLDLYNDAFTISKDEIKITAEYYFRGDLDDRLTLSMPIKEISTPKILMDAIQEYLDNLEQEDLKNKQKEMIEKENREYAEFLRLQKKFANKQSQKVIS